MDFPSESYIPSRGTYLLANGSADDNILNNADYIVDGFSILSLKSLIKPLFSYFFNEE